MKRLLLLVLTISSSMSIVKAQKSEFIKQEKNMLDFYSQKKLTDTTVNNCWFREYGSFTIDEPWRVYSRTYDADSKLTYYIGKEFDTITGLFVPFVERFFTSNMPNDSSMIEISNYAYSDPSHFKNEYFYNNNLLSYSLQYNWIDFVQEYVLIGRGLNYYDNNNYLIKSVDSPLNGSWPVESDTVYYDNDIDGYKISRIRKRGGSLAPSSCGSNYKSEIIDSSFYNYDINHNILVEEDYFYDVANTVDSTGLGDYYEKDTLSFASKYTRTFNLNNKLKSQLYQKVDLVTSTWINDRYEEHFFNSSDLDTLVEFQKWNASLSAWEVNGYVSYEYNISGALLKEWNYTIDVLTGDTLYTYLFVYNSNGDCSGVVGIDEIINNNEILIYPNPTTESITIDLNGIDTPLTYSLMNINGQIVKEGTSNTGLIIENLGSQSNGVYFLRARTEGQIFNYKIIKQ